MKEMEEQKKKRQTTDYRVNACCPFSVLQRAAQRKNVWFAESPRYLEPSGRIIAISTRPDKAGERTTALRRVVIGCGCYYN